MGMARAHNCPHVFTRWCLDWHNQGGNDYLIESLWYLNGVGLSFTFKGFSWVNIPRSERNHILESAHSQY